MKTQHHEIGKYVALMRTRE